MGPCVLEVAVERKWTEGNHELSVLPRNTEWVCQADLGLCAIQVSRQTRMFSAFSICTLVYATSTFSTMVNLTNIVATSSPHLVFSTAFSTAFPVEESRCQKTKGSKQNGARCIPQLLPPKGNFKLPGSLSLTLNIFELGLELLVYRLGGL